MRRPQGTASAENGGRPGNAPDPCCCARYRDNPPRSPDATRFDAAVDPIGVPIHRETEVHRAYKSAAIAGRDARERAVISPRTITQMRRRKWRRSPVKMIFASRGHGRSSRRILWARNREIPTRRVPLDRRCGGHWHRRCDNPSSQCKCGARANQRGLFVAPLARARKSKWSARAVWTNPIRSVNSTCLRAIGIASACRDRLAFVTPASTRMLQ